MIDYLVVVDAESLPPKFKTDIISPSNNMKEYQYHFKSYKKQYVISCIMLMSHKFLSINSVSRIFPSCH